MNEKIVIGLESDDPNSIKNSQTFSKYTEDFKYSVIKTFCSGMLLPYECICCKKEYSQPDWYRINTYNDNFKIGWAHSLECADMWILSRI